MTRPPEAVPTELDTCYAATGGSNVIHWCSSVGVQFTQIGRLLGTLPDSPSFDCVVVFDTRDEAGPAWLPLSWQRWRPRLGPLVVVGACPSTACL